MSDSNRGGRDQDQLKSWLFQAVIWSIAVVVCVSISSCVYQNNASNHAADRARDAQNNIAAECVAGSGYEECARKIKHAARADQRDEYDLSSQQIMATWTWVMGSAAVLGIALSGIGVYLIWQTWDATREAAANSRKTLGAYIAKERAYLQVEAAREKHGTNALHPSVGFVISTKNLGLSAGTINRYCYQYVEEYGWHPRRLIEVAVSDLVPPDRATISPMLPFTTKSRAFTLLGYLDYTSLEEIKGRAHFCFYITYFEDNGLRGEYWQAEMIRPLAMPRDT
jgi:hypothetical protein